MCEDCVGTVIAQKTLAAIFQMWKRSTGLSPEILGPDIKKDFLTKGWVTLDRAVESGQPRDF